MDENVRVIFSLSENGYFAGDTTCRVQTVAFGIIQNTYQMAFFEARFCDSHHSFDDHVGDQDQEQVTCVTEFAIALAIQVGAV